MKRVGKATTFLNLQSSSSLKNYYLLVRAQTTTTTPLTATEHKQHHHRERRQHGLPMAPRRRLRSAKHHTRSRGAPRFSLPTSLSQTVGRNRGTSWHDGRLFWGRNNCSTPIEQRFQHQARGAACEAACGGSVGAPPDTAGRVQDRFVVPRADEPPGCCRGEWRGASQ